MEERIHQLVGRDVVYGETGIQFLFFNTINQLFAEKHQAGGHLDEAADLLFMPDLFAYWLSGEKVQERSMASTSQLLDSRTGQWSSRLLDAMDFPGHLFASSQ